MVSNTFLYPSLLIGDYYSTWKGHFFTIPITKPKWKSCSKLISEGKVWKIALAQLWINDEQIISITSNGGSFWHHIDHHLLPSPISISFVWASEVQKGWSIGSRIARLQYNSICYFWNGSKRNMTPFVPGLIDSLVLLSTMIFNRVFKR